MGGVHQCSLGPQCRRRVDSPHPHPPLMMPSVALSTPPHSRTSTLLPPRPSTPPHFSLPAPPTPTANDDLRGIAKARVEKAADGVIGVGGELISHVPQALYEAVHSNTVASFKG